MHNNTNKSLSTYQVIKVLVLLSLFLLTERPTSLPAGTHQVTEWQDSKNHVPTGATDLPHKPRHTEGACGL